MTAPVPVHDSDEVECLSQPRLHVVVVDDSATDRELSALCLRRAGYEVTVAADLEEARLSRPDVVLLDLHLGPVPPDQTYAEAERLWPRTPILTISGDGGWSAGTYVKAYGFAGLSEQVERAVLAATTETLRATTHDLRLLVAWCRALT